MSEAVPLRITIVGCGLAGAAAAVMLAKIPNSVVTVHERSAAPREAGGWIGITPLAEEILHELAPKHELDRVVERGTVATAFHWQTGEILLPKPVGTVGNAHTMRRDLHELLLRQLEGKVQGNKHGLGLEVKEGGVAVRFEDGTVLESDLVVVADGIRSKLRASLGLDAQVKYSGLVEYMGTFDRSTVSHVPNLPSEADGPAFFVSGKAWMWLSDIGLGRYGIIASTIEPIETAGNLVWDQDGSLQRLEHLRKTFEGWNPVVTGVLAAMTSVSIFPVYRGEWLESLSYHGRVALIGDAAHPTGGAYSAGAGIGFCDVKSLYLALTHVQSASGPLTVPQNLSRALDLYDAARSPFLSKVFALIKKDGEDRDAMSGEGDDETRIGMWRESAGKTDISWLRYHDVDKEFQKVLEAKAVS